MRAWKLMRLRQDGTIGPLFMNATQRVPVGKWLWAEDHERAGFKHRPGWHAMPRRHAPHLTMKGRVWCRVELKHVEEFDKPEAQGGRWLLARRMRVLEVRP